MISITRGSVGMTKALKDMKGSELVAEYNRLAIPLGKPPVKRFATTKDALRRIGELQPVKMKKKAAMEGLCGEFGCREGTNRAKLVAYLGRNLNKEVAISDLIKEVYGNGGNGKNKLPLMMVLKGARVMIEKHKLPYKVVSDGEKISLKDA